MGLAHQKWDWASPSPIILVPRSKHASRTASLLWMRQLSMTRTLFSSGNGFILGSCPRSQDEPAPEKLCKYQFMQHEIKELFPINRSLHDTQSNIAIQ